LALLKDLEIDDLNAMVGAFHKESDRGAAILAGSFLEHYLGVFLRSKTTDSKVAERLFDAMGPLGSFSQRITVAYAFGFIEKHQYSNLEILRKVRNHFAHNPLHASFSDEEVRNKVVNLTTYGGEAGGYTSEHGRQVYVFSCGVLCGDFYTKMKRSSIENNSNETPILSATKA
jgi:hypothetical protein